MSTTLRGQLAVRVGVGGWVTRFEYDGGGRRMRESTAGLKRRYRWDELARLTELVAGDNGEAPAINVVVDALGELASVDGTPLLWDTAHPLGPLTWNREASILGEDGPWALAGRDAARWLSPDWQGTIGDTPRDPWGAPATPGADGDGLGFRGELEIGTDTWLRNRIYQPGSRAFLQPDPLPALPGSATAANPYHYAANNTITRSDPLGLHPLSERELEALRDGMDRNWGDHIADAGKWIGGAAVDAANFAYDNPGTVGMALGLGALAIGTGPLALGLGVAALGVGAAGARNSFRKKEWVGFGLDVAGIVPGVGGVVKGAKAIGAGTRAARYARDAQTATRAADDAARSAAAAEAGGYNPNAVKASHLQGMSKQTETDAHRLERRGRRLDEISTGIGGVSAVRTHLLPKIGIAYPPWTAPAASLLRPPATLSHAP
jgi:RHS repeat-associated protein